MAQIERADLKSLESKLNIKYEAKGLEIKVQRENSTNNMNIITVEKEFFPIETVHVINNYSELNDLKDILFKISIEIEKYILTHNI